MIRFKAPSLKNEFDESPLLLQIIVKDLALFAYENFQIPITITRVLEKIEGATGVHQDHRAVDIRDEHAGQHTFTEDQIKELLAYINNKYYRNDGKPTAIHHSFDGGPFHIHVQIAAQTKTYMRKSG